VSELYAPVQSGLERRVRLGDLRSVAEKELDGVRLTFPAGTVQRRHVLLVFSVDVSALSTTSNLANTSLAFDETVQGKWCDHKVSTVTALHHMMLLHAQLQDRGVAVYTLKVNCAILLLEFRRVLITLPKAMSP